VGCAAGYLIVRSGGDHDMHTCMHVYKAQLVLGLYWVETISDAVPEIKTR
jgi:hypothetical protein